MTADSFTPFTLSKYRATALLGKGGFGTVYRATDTMLDREVALKVLHAQLVVDDDFVRRFKNEAKAIASLRHPNIVGVYELGEDNGRWFIAMEYMPGGTLADRLARGPLPFVEATAVLRQVCAGLETAHTRDIIHRDLKPANILFDAQGQAVVSDFGLMRATQLSSGSAFSSSSAVGTPAYKAPELWNNQSVTAATDLYSLACVCFEMLTGQRLVPASTIEAAISQHLLTPPEELTNHSQLSEAVQAILVCALAKNPNERYPSLKVWLKALDDIENVQHLAREQAALVRKVESLEKKAEKAESEHELIAAVQWWSRAAQFMPRNLALRQKQQAAVQRAREHLQTAEANLEGLQRAKNEQIKDLQTQLASMQSKLGKAASSGDVAALIVFLLVLLPVVGFVIGKNLSVSYIGATQGPVLANLLVSPLRRVYWIALGTWTIDKETFKEVGAEGYSLDIDEQVGVTECKYDSTQPHGRLLAVVDSTYYSTAPFTPTEEGGLYFVINDQCRHDNTGSLLVIAWLDAPPSNSSAAPATATALKYANAVANLDNIKQSVFGPVSGNLEHTLDGYVKTYTAMVDLQDFVVEAVFQNPYSTADGGWDYGFLFRDQGGNEQFRLIVQSDYEWELGQYTELSNQVVSRGQATNLRLGAGESNIIRLYALGTQGWLYINQEFVAELDLSARNNSGDVRVATGLLKGDEIEGKYTAYSGFTVWSLPK